MKIRSIISKRGFALVEVMVAMGVLGIISVGVMRTMENMSRSTKKLAQDTTINTKWNEVMQSLRDRDNCSKTITQNGTLSAGSTTQLNTIFNNSTEVLKKGVTYGSGTQGRIKVEKIEVIVNSAGTSATIQAEFSKQDGGKGSWGARKPVRRLTVNVVESTTGGGIDDCYVDENKLLESVCTLLDGRWHEAEGKCTSLNIYDNFGGVDGDSDDIALTIDKDLKVGKKTRTDSLGVGVDAPAASGDAIINRNLTVNNNATIKNDLTVNNNANVKKDLTVDKRTKTDSLGVGVAAPSTSGDAIINRNANIKNDLTVDKKTKTATLGVGVTAPSTSGDAIINRNLTVNNNATIKGYGKVNKNLTVSQTTTSNVVIINESQSNSLSDKHATTAKWVREWVSKHVAGVIAGTFDSKTKNDIASAILSESSLASARKEWVQDVSIGTIYPNSSSSACGASGVVRAIWYDDGANRIKYNCTNKTVDTRCDTNGTCSNVYSTNYVYTKYVNATGRIYTSSNLYAKDYVYGKNKVTTGGYMYASNYMRASYFYASGKGYCTSNGCRTHRRIGFYSCSRSSGKCPTYKVSVGRVKTNSLDYNQTVCCYAKVW